MTSIWGTLPIIYSPTDMEAGDYLRENQLHDFMFLISSIVSASDLRHSVAGPEIPSDGPDGHRLHWIQRLHKECGDQNDLGTDRGSGNSPPATKGRRQKGQVVLHGPQPKTTDERLKVAALMAGTIFGVILAFLLSESAYLSSFTCRRLLITVIQLQTMSCMLQTWGPSLQAKTGSRPIAPRTSAGRARRSLHAIGNCSSCISGWRASLLDLTAPRARSLSQALETSTNTAAKCTPAGETVFSARAAGVWSEMSRI
jgi:hypothetical protein